MLNPSMPNGSGYLKLLLLRQQPAKYSHRRPDSNKPSANYAAGQERWHRQPIKCCSLIDYG